MTQYYSRIDATLNGDVYNIPFSYMKESEISVYINDEPITAWEFLNESQIKINEMPSEIPADAIVSIRRTTDITKKVIDYTNQSMLNRENLNKSQDQLFNSIQEVYDNNVQFEINIDNKLVEVNEAARLIKNTLETVDQAVETSEQQAQIATEQANIATEKTDEVKSNHEQAIAEITNLADTRVQELESLSDEIKGNAEDIINRLGISMFDTIIKDHTLTYEESQGFALQGTYVYKEALAGSRYGYPDFYAKCLEEKDAGTPTAVTLGDSTITMYVNTNGHQYYDIADKAVIDSWFETKKTADFYGVDTENERIFLPRDSHGELVESYKNGTSWYRVWSDGWCEQGGHCYNESPGTTELTISFLKEFANLNYCATRQPAGVDLNTSSGTSMGYLQLYGFTTNYMMARVSNHLGSKDFMWTACGYLAKGEYTVPLRLKYYVVGNTTNYEGVTEVVNQGMEILEQVSQKVNIDGTNLTDEGKSLIAGYAMPSNKHANLTIGASGTQYTAPANGWFVALGQTTSNSGQLWLNNSSCSLYSQISGNSGIYISTFIPAKKGNAINLIYTNMTIDQFRFVYAEGEI